MGEVEKTNMSNKNIAVVGCGYRGKNLVRNFAELGVLHTICDVDSSGLENLKSLYPWVSTETDSLKANKLYLCDDSFLIYLTVICYSMKEKGA